MRAALILGTTAAALGAAARVYRNRTRLPATLGAARVIVIDSPDEWTRQKDLFVSESRKSGVAGIDCEWVHSSEDKGHRKKVALLQLAPNDRLCFLFRLCRLDVIPTELSELLGNPAIIKVGVAALDDAKKLFTDHGIFCNSCLDIRHMALSCDRSKALLKLGLSLQKLTEDLVGISLDKSTRLRCSNWEAEQLTTKEIAYAAGDALAAFLIAKRIASLCCSTLRVLLTPSWIYDTIQREFGYFLDIPFVSGGAFEARNPDSSGRHSSPKQGLNANTKKSRQAVRSSPFYDNCKLLAPDGEVLATVKRRKANWYLEKGIAHLVSEEPFTVRLNFEPKGRAILDKVYYTKMKENQCVVCGARQDLVCKNVVPHEYRAFLPDIMTQHNSHDILLMCVPCHQRSNVGDFGLRQRLAVMCAAPISEHKYVINTEMQQVIRAAKALVRPTTADIPEARRKELEEKVKAFLNVTELSQDLLESTAQLDPRESNENFVCHGQVVVEYFAENGGLLQLETMWRKHFLTTMKPAHLPELWSIDHHHRSLAYELGKWKAEEANQLLDQIGLSREFVDQVTKEVENAKGREDNGVHVGNGF